MTDTTETPVTNKHWTQSKTILFNVLVAMLTVLTAESETLRDVLSSGGYVDLMLVVSVINAYLRTVTSTSIGKS